MDLSSLVKRYAARWVFSTGATPIGPATVSVEAGRIIDTTSGITPGADDWRDYAITPKFVNAHCHLDLTGAAGACPVDCARPFPEWLASVVRFRRSRSSEDVLSDIRAGLELLAASGTGLVGDIASDAQSFAALTADERLAGVSFRELIGLSPGRAAGVMQAADDWLKSVQGTNRVRPGLSPHSPYTAGRVLLAGAGELAARRHLPVTLHLAESPEEGELLRNGGGPFVPLLQGFGAWEGAEFAADFASAAAPLAAAPRLLLAHGNYLSARDIPPGAAVVYCPRTHAAFRLPRHPVAELLASGVRVCLGTDGLSSNPDLDVLGEARWLYANRPDLGGPTLISLLTEWGAEALGFSESGRLTVGGPAEWVGVPVDYDEPDPYRALFAPPGGLTQARRRVV